MKKIEIFLWIVFLTGILLFKLTDINFLAVFITGFSLSIYYFGFSLFMFNDIRGNILQKNSYENNIPSQILFSIAFGLCFSMFVMSFVFITLAWPGSLFLLVLSIILLIVLVSVIAGKRNTSLKGLWNNLLRRISVIIIVLLFVFFIRLVF